jgi:thiamine pyrophosphokinase
MKAQIVVGKDVPELDKDDLIIGVDVTAYYLLKAGYHIVAVGDFDSCDVSQYKYINEHCEDLIIHPSVKDETDLAIAINYALDQKVDEITIHGAFIGNRMDHLFGNLTLLKKSDTVKINIVDDYNKCYLLRPGKYKIESNKTYISFFAIEAVKELSLKGFKYSLENYDLNVFDPLCVSNEMEENDNLITFNEGLLLVFESNDR